MSTRNGLVLALIASWALAGCDNGTGTDAGGDADMADAGPTESCTDGIRNRDETDVDCGGTCGATCTPGDTCGDGGDCTTGDCGTDGTCQPLASCSDGARNGTETDVDCGGTMCMGCDNGDMCTANGDCTSTFCSGGTCADPVCGNGATEGAEDCDDGSGGTAVESATCDIDCTSVMCGDGIANATADEVCDGDGAGVGGETATCDTDCTVASCGDGVVNVTAGEACDGDGAGVGGETATCNADCSAQRCGDSIINRTAGEQCDDGNTDDTDRCDTSCVINAAPLSPTENVTFDTDGGELEGVVLAGWDSATATLYASSFTVPTGIRFLVVGRNPFRMEVGGAVDISGLVDLSGTVGEAGGCNAAGGTGGQPGAGGGRGGNGGRLELVAPSTIDGVAGDGTGGGRPGRVDEAGGGGAGHLTVGQPGVGEAPTSIPGMGGRRYAALVALEGGSGGGGGSADDDPPIGIDANDDGGGGGGGGGGAISIVTSSTITVTGTIDASGGNGGAGNCDPNSGSGGGGSGGTIVLISSPSAPNVSAGTLDVSAGQGAFLGPSGGNGADGEIYVGLPPSCTDGIEDQDETDADCGGTICGACADGRACVGDADCTSATCVADLCVIAACRDASMNGMETDVDCGGPECGPCGYGDDCVLGTDCRSGICTGTTCAGVGEACSDAAPLTLGLNTVAWVASTNDYSAMLSCMPSFATAAGPDVVMTYTATADGVVDYVVTKPVDTRWVMQVSAAPCGTVAPAASCDSDFTSVMLDGSFVSTMGTTYTFYIVDTDSGPNPLSNPLQITLSQRGGTLRNVDDFEAGWPLLSIWAISGDADWAVSGVAPITGAFSAQSGAIADNEVTTLDLAVTCGAGGLAFFDYVVDSEVDYDFLDFMIDGAFAPGISSWSGAMSGSAAFAVPAGVHTLGWQYSKDSAFLGGVDSAWIDNVRLFNCTAP